MFNTVILTISDTRKKDTDVSADTIKNILGNEFAVYNYEIIPDDKELIKNKLIYYTDKAGVDLILTTGGTGLGPRDVTPEATREILDKQAAGISEFMRRQGSKKNKRAILSRGISGVRKNTIIINLPGSPQGAKESLESILDIIPHALEMIEGKGH